MRCRLCLLLVLALPLSACADLGAVEALRDEARLTQRAVREQATQLERLRETIPDTDPLAPDLDASLASSRAVIEAIDAAITRLDQTLQEAESPSDGLTRAAKGLGPYLPEPIRLPLLLTAALGATLLRSGQLKRGALSIARSIEKAKHDDQALREALARNANTLRSIQTPTARRIVDLAGSRNPLGALPI